MAPAQVIVARPPRADQDRVPAEGHPPTGPPAKLAGRRPDGGAEAEEVPPLPSPITRPVNLVRSLMTRRKQTRRRTRSPEGPDQAPARAAQHPENRLELVNPVKLTHSRAERAKRSGSKREDRFRNGESHAVEAAEGVARDTLADYPRLQAVTRMTPATQVTGRPDETAATITVAESRLSMYENTEFDNRLESTKKRAVARRNGSVKNNVVRMNDVKRTNGVRRKTTADVKTAEVSRKKCV